MTLRTLAARAATTTVTVPLRIVDRAIGWWLETRLDPKVTRLSREIGGEE